MLCRPELKIEPTFTWENWIGRPRIAEIDSEGNTVVKTLERERVYETVVALEVPTVIPRVSFTFESQARVSVQRSLRIHGCSKEGETHSGCLASNSSLDTPGTPIFWDGLLKDTTVSCFLFPIPKMYNLQDGAGTVSSLEAPEGWVHFFTEEVPAQLVIKPTRGTHGIRVQVFHRTLKGFDEARGPRCQLRPQKRPVEWNAISVATRFQFL